MYLAVKTTTSPAETWAIVIVAVICLAFWLTMVVGVAPRPDARRRASREALRAPLAGGMQTRDDMPPVPRPRTEPQPVREPPGASPMDLGGPVPAHRQSATDEAAPSQRRGR
jgi:hypothetical protein